MDCKDTSQSNPHEKSDGTFSAMPFRISLPLLGLVLWLVYYYSDVKRFEIRQKEGNNDTIFICDSIQTFQDKIVLKDKEGHVILEKNINNLWRQPLHKWNYRTETLFFMHIVKSSGTSFGHSLRQSFHSHRCHITCSHNFTQLVNQTCESDLKVFCGGHFDWGQVEKLENTGIKTTPIVLLRNTVNRVASHFYYVHSWYKNLKMSDQNFSEYLSDPVSMMQSQHVWFDGQVRR